MKYTSTSVLVRRMNEDLTLQKEDTYSKKWSGDILYLMMNNTVTDYIYDYDNNVVNCTAVVQ